LNIKNLFASIIKRYITFLANKAYVAHQLNLLRLSQLKNSPELIADLGCGNGDLSVKLFDTFKLVGVDINIQRLKAAKLKGLQVIVADLNKSLPFRVKSFDIVFSDQVIEHLIDVDNFAHELKRILKDDGIAIVRTENLASWPNIFALLIGVQPSSGPYISSEFKIGFHPVWNEPDLTYSCYTGHNKVFAYRSLLEFFKSHGFEILHSYGAGYYPFPFNLLAKIDKVHSHLVVVAFSKKDKVS
jgi:SAM-dependent methyltransferase